MKNVEKTDIVGSVMSREIITISPRALMIEAVNLMYHNQISCVVITEGETPVGIVTERDIVNMVANWDDVSRRVLSAMSKPLITVTPQTSFNRALNIMRTNHIRRLPVVRKGVLAGLVTESDLLVASRKEIFDISCRYRQVKKMAEKDKLTGLYNRGYFNNFMKEELKRAKKCGALLSLILIDIDHFKKVNDNFGHQAGDYILRKISKIIKANARKIDAVSRYGGEEFAVICPISGTRSSRIFAERLRRKIEETTFIFNKDEINITISAGICKYTSVYSSMKKIIEGADQALYKAKEKGRNQVCLAR